MYARKQRLQLCVLCEINTAGTYLPVSNFETVKMCQSLNSSLEQLLYGIPIQPRVAVFSLHKILKEDDKYLISVRGNINFSHCEQTWQSKMIPISMKNFDKMFPTKTFNRFFAIFWNFGQRFQTPRCFVASKNFCESLAYTYYHNALLGLGTSGSGLINPWLALADWAMTGR